MPVFSCKEVESLAGTPVVLPPFLAPLACMSARMAPSTLVVGGRVDLGGCVGLGGTLRQFTQLCLFQTSRLSLDSLP